MEKTLLFGPSLSDKLRCNVRRKKLVLRQSHTNRDSGGRYPRLHAPPSSSQFFLVRCGFSEDLRPCVAVLQAGGGTSWGVGLMYKDVSQ